MVINKEGSLTIEQHEGYVICLKDKLKLLKEEVKNYEDTLNWRKKFTDKKEDS